MLWKRRDMGSDIMKPIYVTTDLPVVDGQVSVNLPIAAYKRLVDWCSMGRTMDNVERCLADGSPDTENCHLAYEEIGTLRKALCEVHHAVRQHYVSLPHTVEGQP